MFDKKLQSILNDNKSGSKELLVELRKYLSGLSTKKISALLPQLKKQFVEFNTIETFLNKLERSIKEKNVNEFLQSQLINEKIVFKKIYSNLPLKVQRANSLITFSNSKTVAEILKLIFKENKNFTVTVCESRPQCEGKNLAKQLSKAGIKINFITEAQIPEFVSTIDASIIGADQLLKSGNVVNKVGSKNLAIICKYFGKPFYVLADKTKKSNRNTFSQKQHPAEEIWKTKDENVNIKNFYFEEVEIELITSIITD